MTTIKSRTKNNIAFYKNKKGEVWFAGIYSNNFMDRDEEIITWDGHKEYADWYKTSGAKLPIVMLHLPHYAPEFHIAHVIAVQKGIITPQEYSENLRELYKTTTIATAEAVIPLNGFMLVLGKVRKDREKLVKKFSDSWGMSHGFIRLEYDGNIISKYRTFEFTVAPIDWAANSITTIGFNKDKIMTDKALSIEDRELIEEALEVSADDLEAGTEKAREILSRMLASKATIPEPEEPEVTEEEPAVEEKADDYAELRAKIFADLDVEGLVAAMKKMSETNAELEARLAAVEVKAQKSQDEVIAAHIAPDWSLGLSTSKTAGETDPELIKELKEKTERQIVADPKAKMSDNPINLGFWSQFAGEH